MSGEGGREPTSAACVYLYRAAGSSRIRYVGRGTTPERALAHTGGTHNEKLAALIHSGEYILEVAGPYPTVEHAQLVEAALISALRLDGDQAQLANNTSGHGPRFVPLGVPGQFADRALLPALTLNEIGRHTGGALLVRNSFGGDLGDGRPRLDAMSQQQDDIIVDNITKHWMLERVADQWHQDPDSKPHVVLGAAGPLRHRYVPGSLVIDRSRIGTEPVREIPVLDTPHLDAAELRGRLLADARFAQARSAHFIWVDGEGRVRHPAP